ncbi:jg19395 [Pararge aegeria aegeria]|uniref:Jg19395 protein n=1 Tax=Pararge aegeria aegeria TaxID=348720 RepID=A0A8S4R8B8_9NEOP|nr:jg19395 [Pararge aegeria aegeria]
MQILLLFAEYSKLSLNFMTKVMSKIREAFEMWVCKLMHGISWTDVNAIGKEIILYFGHVMRNTKKICPIMTTLGRRVGHRRARLIAPASLLPDTNLFSLDNSKWLYRHLSVARASSVSQGAPRAGEDGNLGG